MCESELDVDHLIFLLKLEFQRGRKHRGAVVERLF